MKKQEIIEKIINNTDKYYLAVLQDEFKKDVSYLIYNNYIKETDVHHYYTRDVREWIDNVYEYIKDSIDFKHNTFDRFALLRTFYREQGGFGNFEKDLVGHKLSKLINSLQETLKEFKEFKEIKLLDEIDSIFHGINFYEYLLFHEINIKLEETIWD